MARKIKTEPLPEIPNQFIVEAAKLLDDETIPKGRKPRKYVVRIDGHDYPHKQLISIAHKLWKGMELPVSKFRGGWDQTNPYLINKGFDVRHYPSGEPVSLEERRRETNDFSPILKVFLEETYSIKIEKGKGRSRLIFPSGATIHVRGSKILPTGAFYYLQKEDYSDIITNSNWFFVAVYGDPANTFVFPKEKLTEIFSDMPFTEQKGKKPKWYFDIKQKDGRYILTPHYAKASGIDITNYLNKWDQIQDLRNGVKKVISPRLYITSTSQENLSVSKIKGLVGWKQTSRTLSAGDYVFKYNKDIARIDSCVRIISPSTDNLPLWPDELRSSPPKVIYKYRWNARLVCDKIDIDRATLQSIEPFRSYKFKKRLGILLMGNNPKSLMEPKYSYR